MGMQLAVPGNCLLARAIPQARLEPRPHLLEVVDPRRRLHYVGDAGARRVEHRARSLAPL